VDLDQLLTRPTHLLRRLYEAQFVLEVCWSNDHVRDGVKIVNDAADESGEEDSRGKVEESGVYVAKHTHTRAGSLSHYYFALNKSHSSFTPK
jgi:hypothetical protein